jgi:hypothetical protein
MTNRMSQESASDFKRLRRMDARIPKSALAAILDRRQLHVRRKKTSHVSQHSAILLDDTGPAQTLNGPSRENQVTLSQFLVGSGINSLHHEKKMKKSYENG